MTALEKKARVVVKEAYFDYKVSRSQYAYNVYSSKMEMLEQLFPITTNQENLERKWDIEFKKEND
jgi:hypothetical protein